ncbi:Uncharacterized protein LW94_1506 [Fusarium fujikuroi]|uniref:Uncharacterized protein n=1 Tax=Fusarium fujikuroi TaxID=5127 RepID=A0A0J0A0X7_FUSFU|nr:Uncharacterized protein LW93_7470 [Fusarium fujikuroi]KLP13737.1 Uncharacterized protein LW94_1506 [Fusarium fujikuroi]VTT59296.1 unnamed protein product [Fusarium fujikuroi]VTT63460.1 unnamed protein product [Fusarium fujikuroi]VZH88019.1 unnamed protein product [Fusarium fujikuroi]
MMVLVRDKPKLPATYGVQNHWWILVSRLRTSILNDRNRSVCFVACISFIGERKPGGFGVDRYLCCAHERSIFIYLSLHLIELRSLYAPPSTFHGISISPPESEVIDIGWIGSCLDMDDDF